MLEEEQEREDEEEEGEEEGEEEIDLVHEVIDSQDQVQDSHVFSS